MDLRAMLAQPVPLLVAVNQNTALIENPLQKERRPGLDPLQLGDVDAATADPLQAYAQPKAC